MMDEEELGYVYFMIGSADWVAASTPLCKVGWSLDPLRRLKVIQTASPFPVRLVALVENATKKDERWYHNFFYDELQHGEWFWVRGELFRFLRDNRTSWINDWEYESIIPNLEQSLAIAEEVRARMATWSTVQQ